MLDAHEFSTVLADLAVESLIEEVSLTPKPGLVDKADQGAHKDLTYSMMVDSAKCLHQTYYEMAMASFTEFPSQSLREKIGEIGRAGEVKMYETTNGVNTHKGAIWSLGLLTAAAAIHKKEMNEKALCVTAGEIAKYEDRFIPSKMTNGMKAIQKYGVHGAKVEAQLAFPHIQKYSLPTLKNAITKYDYETSKFYCFLSLLANLDDTCLLHRGGMEGLKFAKESALQLLETGNLAELKSLNKRFIELNLSPGGSADLLAATIYLYKLSQYQKQVEEKHLEISYI